MVEVGCDVTTVDQEVIGFRGQGLEKEGGGETEGVFGRTYERDSAARSVVVSFPPSSCGNAASIS
jgi:hypothetical protein